MDIRLTLPQFLPVFTQGNERFGPVYISPKSKSVVKATLSKANTSRTRKPRKPAESNPYAKPKPWVAKWVKAYSKVSIYRLSSLELTFKFFFCIVDFIESINKYVQILPNFSLFLLFVERLPSI